MFCLDRHLRKERLGSRWESAFIWKLRWEIARGGVTSLPVTPGGTSEHLAGKLETTEHEPSETLGRLWLSIITREDKAEG